MGLLRIQEKKWNKSKILGELKIGRIKHYSKEKRIKLTEIKLIKKAQLIGSLKTI